MFTGRDIFLFSSNQYLKEAVGMGTEGVSFVVRADLVVVDTKKNPVTKRA